MSRGARARADCVVGRLEDFLVQQGLGEGLRTPLMIEAFVAIGLSGHASSTRGTYRSVLRGQSGRPRGPMATPFPGSSAPRPYSSAEQAQLWAIARSQRFSWRRHSAVVLLCCCIGAGLRARELLAARAEDVVCDGETTVVSVKGNSARLVPVSAPYDAVLVELAGDACQAEYLFHPEEADRSYKNFVNDFCANLVRDPGSPSFSVLRGRSSFLCDHLEARTPLSVLVEISGLQSVESLRRHALYVQGVPRTNAGLRRALAEGQA